MLQNIVVGRRLQPASNKLLWVWLDLAVQALTKEGTSGILISNCNVRVTTMASYGPS